MWVSSNPNDYVVSRRRDGPPRKEARPLGHCTVGVLEPIRYSEIEDAFGGEHLLTVPQLDEAVEAGLRERQCYAESPPRIAYSLTVGGEEMSGVSEPPLEWVETRGAQ